MKVKIFENTCEGACATRNAKPLYEEVTKTVYYYIVFEHLTAIIDEWIIDHRFDTIQSTLPTHV